MWAFFDYFLTVSTLQNWLVNLLFLVITHTNITYVTITVKPLKKRLKLIDVYSSEIFERYNSRHRGLNEGRDSGKKEQGK